MGLICWRPGLKIPLPFAGFCYQHLSILFISTRGYTYCIGMDDLRLLFAPQEVAGRKEEEAGRSSLFISLHKVSYSGACSPLPSLSFRAQVGLATLLTKYTNRYFTRYERSTRTVLYSFCWRPIVFLGYELRIQRTAQT